MANLASHVYQQLIAPHIYEYGMAPHFKGKFLGCRDLCDRVGQDSYIELMWMLQALLQHYGRRSWWLDMTFDPRVAMFFASYDAERSAVETQGCGYVFWVALADIREDWSPVIDTGHIRYHCRDCRRHGRKNTDPGRRIDARSTGSSLAGYIVENSIPPAQL